MRVLFVDSAFYIAVLNPRDRFYTAATAIRLAFARQSDELFVTTESVLVEVLTRLSKAGPHMRAAAADFIERLWDDPRLTILPQESALFFAGLDLYRRRLDKNYSMTDCMSMVVCRQRGITDVLTADHDFEQEGFTVLLKRGR